MRAVVYDRYGGPEVLQTTTVDRPTAEGDDLLVEIRASAVTQGDRRLRAADFPGFLAVFGRLATGLFGPRHRVPGTNFAGRVAEIGDDVTRFEVGDDVFGACMYGAHAEYLAISEESAVARLPEKTTYEEAADLPYGAGTAWTFLREFGEVHSGEHVVVIGAAGGVGRWGVQIAKYLGADVTAVCRGSDAAFVRRLGADHVVDYRTEHLARSGETYDVVFDTSGTASFGDCRHCLGPEGRYLTLIVSLRLLLQMGWTTLSGGRRAIGGVAMDSKECLVSIRELVENDAIRPVVDSRYPLDEIREAHARLEGAHPKGSVVVTMD